MQKTVMHPYYDYHPGKWHPRSDTPVIVEEEGDVADVWR